MNPFGNFGNNSIRSRYEEEDRPAAVRAVYKSSRDFPLQRMHRSESTQRTFSGGMQPSVWDIPGRSSIQSEHFSQPLPSNSMFESKFSCAPSLQANNTFSGTSSRMMQQSEMNLSRGVPESVKPVWSNRFGRGVSEGMMRTGVVLDTLSRQGTSFPRSLPGGALQSDRDFRSGRSPTTQQSDFPRPFSDRDARNIPETPSRMSHSNSIFETPLKGNNFASLRNFDSAPVKQLDRTCERPFPGMIQSGVNFSGAVSQPFLPRSFSGTGGSSKRDPQRNQLHNAQRQNTNKRFRPQKSKLRMFNSGNNFQNAPTENICRPTDPDRNKSKQNFQTFLPVKQSSGKDFPDTLPKSMEKAYNDFSRALCETVREAKKTSSLQEMEVQREISQGAKQSVSRQCAVQDLDKGISKEAQDPVTNFSKPLAPYEKVYQLDTKTRKWVQMDGTQFSEEVPDKAPMPMTYKHDECLEVKSLPGTNVNSAFYGNQQDRVNETNLGDLRTSKGNTAGFLSGATRMNRKRQMMIKKNIIHNNRIKQRLTEFREKASGYGNLSRPVKQASQQVPFNQNRMKMEQGNAVGGPATGGPHSSADRAAVKGDLSVGVSTSDALPSSSAPTGPLKQETALEDLTDKKLRLNNSARKKLKRLLNEGVPYLKARAMALSPLTVANPNRCKTFETRQDLKSTAEDKIGIFPVDYPTAMLSTKQMETIQQSLLKAILLHKEKVKPSFKELTFLSGWILANCGTNQEMEGWLKNHVANLELEGVKLNVLKEKDFPRLYTATVVLPQSSGDSVEDIQDYLVNQNEGLEATDWKLVSRKDDDSDVVLVYTVGQLTADRLTKDNLLNFKFGQVTMQLANESVKPDAINKQNAEEKSKAPIPSPAQSSLRSLSQTKLNRTNPLQEDLRTVLSAKKSASVLQGDFKGRNWNKDTDSSEEDYS